VRLALGPVCSDSPQIYLRRVWVWCILDGLPPCDSDRSNPPYHAHHSEMEAVIVEAYQRPSASPRSLHPPPDPPRGAQGTCKFCYMPLHSVGEGSMEGLIDLHT